MLLLLSENPEIWAKCSSRQEVAQSNTYSTAIQVPAVLKTPGLPLTVLSGISVSRSGTFCLRAVLLCVAAGAGKSAGLSV